MPPTPSLHRCISLAVSREEQVQAPWGEGKWGAVGDGKDTLFMNFVSAEREVVLGE